MKLATLLSLPLLLTLANPLAHSQISQIKHVVVIVQENRTPDNLFAADTTIPAGADIQNLNSAVACKGVSGGVLLAPYPLDVCWDPDHSHIPGFVNIYDGGLMDGACNSKVSSASCAPNPVPEYAPDSYVDNSTGILSPYYQIAQNYGFANYMFQTNQGPSFEAHQFLFSGTSAPVPYLDPTGLWTWFAGELPTVNGVSSSYSGCASSLTTLVLDVNPTPPPPENYAYTPPYIGYPAGYPCYNHNTLATLLDNFMVNGQLSPITWKYYTPPALKTSEQGMTIWTAPNAIQSICPIPNNGTCSSSDWANVIPSPRSGDYAPILTDISYPNCALAAVNWVVPDGHWSDHPGEGSSEAEDGGASWVAAIVNAIGTQNTQNGHSPNCGYWESTVILVT